jgi:hypothetical protein
MASLSVKTAVEARLATWVHILNCPFVDENEVANSPLQTFITVEYPVSNEDRINVGLPGLFRESGGFRFVIHILNLSGFGDALGWVDEIRNLFRDAQFAGIMTFAAAPAAFDKSNKAGAFYLLPFVVTYKYDITRVS